MRDKETKNSRKREIPAGQALQLEHIFPEGQRAMFSNHITVQHNDEGEFTIAFFEILHPVLLGEPSDIAAQLEKLESVKAHCVARVVVSEKRMPKFIAALASNYESFESGHAPLPMDQDKKHAG